MPKIEWFLSPKESDSIKDGIWLWREVLVTQVYLILWDTMNWGPPDSSVHGILQARILEGVDIPLFRGSSWSSDQTQVSCIAVRLFTIWATREVHQMHAAATAAKLLQSSLTLCDPIECMRLPIFWNCREPGHWEAQTHFFQDKDQRFQGIS